MIHIRRQLPWLGIALILGLAIGSPGSAQAPRAGREDTRRAMREIFSQLQILLPAAVRDELDNPGRKAEFGTALDGLKNESNALSEHGGALGPGARLFGRTLARDVRRAREFFYRGQFENSAIFVESLVDNCADCHARLAAEDSPIAQGFVRNEALQALDPLELAATAVATRRFEEGMERYEAVLQTPGGLADILLEPIVRYLMVTLRVARDPARALRLITQYAKHPDLAPAIQTDLQHWMNALRGLSPDDFSGTNLTRARKAAEAGDRIAQYPGDPKALIEFLVASSQLQDLLLLPQDSPAAAAEIYELLGRAEMGVGHGVWLSRADLYWETAIRIAPASPAARRAYARLEAETRESFTGPGGLQLPAEEEQRLRDLRALVEGRGDAPTERKALERYGARLFAEHCVFCHGVDAAGEALGRAPLMASEDLTRIALRRGGVYPDTEIFALIARRDPLGKHRSPEMPRWGEFWRDDSKIDALVAYLRSIQRH